MIEFDYNLFRKLFDRLYLFSDFVFGGESREGAEVIDNVDSSDITPCLDLSIFPQLGNITRWGENVDLMDYHEIKDGDRITGAKGVIISGMDWQDVSEPTFFFEFGHIERDGTVDEYVRELHIDNLIMHTLGHYDKKPDGPNKGSEEGRELVRGAIERGDLHPELKKEILYNCILEAEYAHIWKVGLHQSSYQIFFTALGFISGIKERAFVHHYLRGSKMEMGEPVKPMDADTLKKVMLRDYGGNWFNVGAIDLDPELTAKKTEEARVHAELDLAKNVYALAVESQFEDIDPDSLPTVVSHYDAPNIATLMTSTLGKGEVADRFRSQFTRACEQYCPDRLKEARQLMKTYLE